MKPGIFVLDNHVKGFLYGNHGHDVARALPGLIFAFRMGLSFATHTVQCAVIEAKVIRSYGMQALFMLHPYEDGKQVETSGLLLEAVYAS